MEDAEQCLKFKLKTDILIMLSFLNIENDAEKTHVLPREDQLYYKN